MLEYFTLKRAWARNTLVDDVQEKQEIQGESPFKEVLEQVKRNADTDCNAQILRRAYNAGKSGNWESFKEEFRKKESSVNGLLRGFRRLMTMLPWKISAV